MAHLNRPSAANSPRPACRCCSRNLCRQEQRRRLQQAAAPAAAPHHHTTSEGWGALLQAEQFLVTHRPGLKHAEQEALVQHLEGAGCHLAHFLPDATLLVVGPASAAEAVRQHPHVLWVEQHDEQDKLAPEWQRILQQLKALAEQQRQPPASAANASLAAGMATAALRDALPVATQWDAPSGQLLVGVSVAFPGLVAPHPRAAAAAAATARRARRVALQRQQQDAGSAAVADWAPLLQAQFGARIRRAGPDAALVLAPAPRLPAVLEWLAQRPAAHWVSPAPKLRPANKRASSIAQVGAEWWMIMCGVWQDAPLVVALSANWRAAYPARWYACLQASAVRPPACLPAVCPRPQRHLRQP